MPNKTRIQNQDCVYWPLNLTESGAQSYNSYGEPQFADPQELKCRWEGRIEKFMDDKGEEVVSKAVVMVDGVAAGGVLMLGTLDDITDEDNPLLNQGAYQIKRYDTIPNRKATVMFRWAYL